MSAVFERQKSLCKNHWIGSYHPELVPPGNARFKSLAQLSGNVLFESVVRCGPKTTGSFYLIFWFFSSRARFSILTWEDQLQIALRLLADREKNFWEKIKCWCNILIVYERTSPALHLCFTCTVAKRVDDYSPNLVLEVHILHHGGDEKQRNNQLYTALATKVAKLKVPEHKHSVTMTRFQAFCCRNNLCLFSWICSIKKSVVKQT